MTESCWPPARRQTAPPVESCSSQSSKTPCGPKLLFHPLMWTEDPPPQQLKGRHFIFVSLKTHELSRVPSETLRFSFFIKPKWDDPHATHQRGRRRANRRRAFYGPSLRGADWASVGSGGQPDEAGITQEHGLLGQPATRCYSYTLCRLTNRKCKSIAHFFVSSVNPISLFYKYFHSVCEKMFVGRWMLEEAAKCSFTKTNVSFIPFLKL